MTKFNIDFEYEKKIIGILIGFYRKKLDVKLAFFLINKKNYYHEYCLACKKCENTERICSPKTLYQIEKGFVIKNECFYYRLCENINKKLIFNKAILKKLDNYRELLYNSIVDFSKQTLFSLLKEIESDILKFKNTIYIEERLTLYRDVINYKLKRIIPSHESVEIYVLLKDNLAIEDEKIILLLLYDISYKIKNNLIDRDKIISESKKYYKDPLFFRMMLFSNVDISIAYSLFEKYEADNFTQLNLYQKYTLYEYISFIDINYNCYEKGYHNLKKCIEIIKEGADFSDYTIKNCSRQMGIVCYLLNKYYESIEYFYSILKYKQFSIGLNYVLLFNCLEKTNQVNKILKIIEEINIATLKNKNEKLIMIYYWKKHLVKKHTKPQIAELEDFICEELVNIVVVGGELYERIFKEDLRQYVSITKDYKKFFSFDVAIHKV